MKGKRKLKVGKVVSTKMDKTAVVEVEREFLHPLYRKRIRKTKKYKVHDERNELREGDWVEIEETHPLSKEKRWRLCRIIRRERGE